MDFFDVYKLKLNENVELPNWFTVTRVPGGWIYTHRGANTSTFVPLVPKKDA